MTTHFYSIPLLVATAVLLSMVTGHLALRKGPLGWARVLAWIAIMGGSLGLSMVLFSTGSVGRLQGSLALLSRFSHSEECVEAPKQDHSENGLRAFEEWARKVRRDQEVPNGEAPPFSRPSGEECGLRHPDEPWLHYRLRRLASRLDFSSGSAKSHDHAPSRWATLKRKLALLWLGKHEHRFQFVWSDFQGTPERTADVATREIGEFLREALSVASVRKEPGEVLETLFASFYLSRVKDAPTFRSAEPRWLPLPDSSACEALAADPGAHPETRAIADALSRRASECRSGKASDELCDFPRIARGILLGCVVRGERLSREVMSVAWPGVSREWGLSVRVLKVPDDYFSASPAPERAYRVLRMARELAWVLDPQFQYQAPRSELPGDAFEEKQRVRLAEGHDFPLTRLGALSLFSPFSEKELPVEIQARFGWTDYRKYWDDLLRQFRSVASSHRRDLI